MRRRLLVDTNLLLLLVVGSTSRDFIAAHKRTNHYTTVDFDLLSEQLGRNPSIVTTPNLMSEASNLLRQVAEPRRSALLAVFERLVERVAETYVPSAEAVKHPAFAKLGLPDAVSLVAQDKGVTLLTDDFDLYVASIYAGGKAVNFAYLREARAR